jgi:hypothetical protein
MDITCLLNAGFRPGSRATFVSAKVAKTIDAPSGLIAEEGRQLRRADQLARLKHGPPNAKSVPPVGQPEGVGGQKKHRSRCRVRASIHRSLPPCPLTSSPTSLGRYCVAPRGNSAFLFSLVSDG